MEKLALKLTSQERTLLVEMGYHIARAMLAFLAHGKPEMEAVMWDKATSTFSLGCRVLDDLRVFTPVGAATYRAQMPLREVRAHLQDLEPRTRYSLDEIIGSFVWAVGELGEIDDRRAPFEVPDQVQEVMWAFVELGYATREPTGFRWAEKIRPAMIASFAWNADGISWQEAEEQEAVHAAEVIWQAIPLAKRRELAGKHVYEVINFVISRWDRERFHFNEQPVIPLRERLFTRHNEMVAEHIIERLRSLR